MFEKSCCFLSRLCRGLEEDWNHVFAVAALCHLAGKAIEAGGALVLQSCAGGWIAGLRPLLEGRGALI